MHGAQIAKVVAGTFTSLGTFDYTSVTLAVIHAEIIGTTISLYYNGLLIGSVSDGANSFPSGSPGIYAYDSQTPLTNFRGGDFIWTVPVKYSAGGLTEG